MSMSYQNLSEEINRLVDKTNEWSSTIVIPQGDLRIDISSAAMGDSSATPAEATNQPVVFPKGKGLSFYRFDPDIYGEFSWPQIFKMFTKNGCVSGCNLVTRNSCTVPNSTRKATHYLWCTHGLVVKNHGASIINEGDVGACNVVKERVKRVKTPGAIKGEHDFVLYKLYYSKLYYTYYPNCVTPTSIISIRMFVR